MNIQRFRCLLVLFSLLLGTGYARAQDTQKKTVSGNVINKDTKEPLQGVTVNLKGTTTTVVTDAKGYFSITPPQRMKSVLLTFSHVGFNSRSMSSDLDEVLVVTMDVSNKSMDEVVVVGYGTQKKSNVLGSIATVQAKDVEDMPTANLSTALVNVVPGVGVAQTSGKPGSTTNITIRGAYTFASGGSTSPLFVIDGLVPLITNSSNVVDPTGKVAFDLLDPSEIETITFLKDASATIYGARGANGVVLVTTKRGHVGKPRVSYSGSYSAENASKVPKMIDPYSQALLLNNWVENYDPYKVQSTEIYTPAELDSIKAHNGVNSAFKSIWQPGYNTRHTVNVSGGTDKFTFFVGGNYYGENGNIQNDDHRKYGFDLGMTAHVTDDLTVDLQAGLSNSYNSQPVPKGLVAGSDQVDQENILVGTLLTTPGYAPETIGGLPVYNSYTKWSPMGFMNSGSYTHDNSNTSQINLSVTYKVPFIKGLSLKGQYGRNTYNDLAKQWFVPYNAYNFYTPGVHKNSGSGTNTPTGTNNVIYEDSVISTTKVSNGDELYENWVSSTNWQATEGFDYTNTWGKHFLDVAAYAEQQETNGTTSTDYRQTQVIPNVDQFYAYASTSENVAGDDTYTGRVSYLGRLSYTYNNKYMLQAAFREDASPQFYYTRQWGFFPSVSVGWMASQEKWFQKAFKGINDFKVRYNMGLTGNDNVGSFLWVTTYSATSPIGYLFGANGNSPVNGIQPSTTVANPEIGWERDLFKDLGFDGTFGQRKFHFTVDLWYKSGNNMLQQASSTVPTTFGANIAEQNYAALHSWGDEWQLGYTGHVSRDWTVFATVNLGFSIAGNNKVIREYYSAGTDTGYLYPIGQRTDRGITGYKATGIVRTQADVNAFYAKHPGWTINGDSLRVGDLNYADVNGDGVINSNDETQIAKRTNNIMSAGYILGAQWKGLKLTTNIAMSIGGTQAWSKTDITPPTKDQAGLAMWKNSYTAANPNAPLPAIYAPFANQASTFWLHSSTYLYVNNLQLSYTLPQAMLGRYHIPEARVYLTGQNLWTIINPTPYRDPRSNEITDYPILRTWTFGLNVNL